MKILKGISKILIGVYKWVLPVTVIVLAIGFIGNGENASFSYVLAILLCLLYLAILFIFEKQASKFLLSIRKNILTAIYKMLDQMFIYPFLVFVLTFFGISSFFSDLNIVVFISVVNGSLYFLTVLLHYIIWFNVVFRRRV